MSNRLHMIEPKRFVSVNLLNQYGFISRYSVRLIPFSIMLYHSAFILSRKSLFFLSIVCIVNVSFSSCPRVRVYARSHVGEEKTPEFLAGQRLMSFSFGNSTAVLLYRSTHYRTWVSIKQFPHTIIRLSEYRFQDVLYHHTIPITLQ